MPRPKNPEIQEALKTWVGKNPERWYTAKYEDIHAETGVSLSSIYRYFPLIVARAADILPSQVMNKRNEEQGISPWRRNLSKEEVAEIHRLYKEEKTVLDIAFITGRSPSQIEKYKPKKEDTP